MDACLDDNDVQAFFRGRLSASRSAIVQKHVDQCSMCRHLVAEVARTTSENRAIPSAVPPTPRAQQAPQERVVIRDGKVTRRPSEVFAVPTPPPRSKAKRPSAAAVGPGSVLADRYRLERILGEGGTGVVWEATHVVMRRRVALKILKSKDEEASHRFFREARVTAALRHAHIVEVSDVFVVPETSTPAMVMELLSGGPLSHWIRPKGKPPVALPVHHTARILLPVAAAVGAAHAVGVVHRDLKPENVFLVGEQPSLDDPMVKVLDFGLAKLTADEGDVAATAQLTRSGFVLGTPHYMSPEQVAGDVKIDHRTDVWSLGVILYECLCGVRPIDGDNISRLFRAVLEAKILPVEKQSAHDLPKALAKIVNKCLSRKAKDRPELSEVHDVLAKQV
jgi:eukaryotic-like serine/threonine-protein kinase